jgi:hypothetical protein
MSDELRKHCADIGTLLRDHPPGTTADIAEYCVLFWDGDQLTGAHLSADPPGEPDEPSTLTKCCPKFPSASRNG